MISRFRSSSAVQPVDRPTPDHVAEAVREIEMALRRLPVEEHGEVDGHRQSGLGAIADVATKIPIALVAGIGAWIVGVEQIDRARIGYYGLLATGDVPFVFAFALLAVGFLLELGHRARSWVLAVYLVALLVAIHATVPIIWGTPEYAWVYKHIAVTQQLGFRGHITDSSNIYQLWPLLFAGAAALASLGQVSPVTIATWAPLAFELATLLMIVSLFRLLRPGRTAWLAALLYVGLVSWVGQDYFSPQAYGYVLWMGMLLIVLRWLRFTPAAHTTGRIARLRRPLLIGLDSSPAVSTRMRMVAVALVAIIYFAIVAAHQLTPYLALAAIAGLELLGVIRPRWLLLLVGAIAIGFLIPRYSFIVHNFGGVFSGGNPISNASGRTGTYHTGAERFTAWIVRALAASMWVGTIIALLRRWRQLGRVVVPATLAFTPFVIAVVQSYGGEAIYRIFLFSCPWCALLIADELLGLRMPRPRWVLITALSAASLFAGLQGLYGPVRVRTYTKAELAASRWLYSHAPTDGLVVFPDENFPAPQGVYDNYTEEDIPADPQLGSVTVDEGNVDDVENWVASLNRPSALVVFSRSMAAYVGYFGEPSGYSVLVASATHSPGWSLVYENADASIYRLDLTRAGVANVGSTSTHTRSRGSHKNH